MRRITAPDAVSVDELRRLVPGRVRDFVKGVVDLRRGILLIDADMHADQEAALLADGSEQRDRWGISLYAQLDGPDSVEFNSMINLRPSFGNWSRASTTKLRARPSWHSSGRWCIGERAAPRPGGRPVARAVARRAARQHRQRSQPGHTMAGRNDELARGALERALELFDLTLDDPRHRQSPARLREIARARDVVVDFFDEPNDYHSTAARLQKYFDAYALAVRP